MDILHSNVVNFWANFHKFQTLLAFLTLVPGLFVLSETWFIQDSPCELNCHISCLVTNRKGRGERMSDL